MQSDVRYKLKYNNNIMDADSVCSVANLLQRPSACFVDYIFAKYLHCSRVLFTVVAALSCSRTCRVR